MFVISHRPLWFTLPGAHTSLTIVAKSILVVAILMWLLFYTTVYKVAKSILVVAILMWLLFCTIVYIVAKSILVVANYNVAVILYNCFT